MKKAADEATIDLAEFICQSDLIEGIQDDPDLLISQIEERKKDGHVGAMLMLERLVQSALNHGGYVTDELVCGVQRLITAEQHLKPGGDKLDSEFVGKYRPDYVLVCVGERRCLPSSQVPVEMTKLLTRNLWWQSNARFQSWDANLRHVADFHFRFEIIHPFADGNGRTGRALAYYLLRWAGLKPILFTENDKFEQYYPCFKNDEDPTPMKRYFWIKSGQDPDKFTL